MTEPEEQQVDDVEPSADGDAHGADDAASEKQTGAGESRAAGRAAAAARAQMQASWVDQQIRVAMARGEFDDLPGAGRPIEGLGGDHDPDWWLKKLIERERVAVLPASLQLRKDDAELDARLDTLGSPAEARAAIEDFNERVIRARYGVPEGPPLITMPRDVESTLAGWYERRAARVAARAVAGEVATTRSRRRRWWRRRRSD
ncbi:DUF1992 domain-containing protein [Nocardioides sp. R-C-SC26]|uniref:DnaJ family domain-containing protein n=1 Tax=Nocardioides sp. R-C-SC26 TaxID=2870414 RepID=UPI001E47AD7F|nr:DUF1992 domain-containing protein [Nocardioides sp. R-C-SC26]